MWWEESGEGHRSLNVRYSLLPNIILIMSGNSDITLAHFASQYRHIPSKGWIW